MSSFEIGKNRILTIRSSDRVSGTPSNFSVNLAQFNLTPRYCSFHQVALPNGFFNISSRSNTLSLTVYDSSSQPYAVSITVTPGNYTTSTLGATVIGALNTALYGKTASAGQTFFSVPTSYTTAAGASISAGSGASQVYTNPITGYFTLVTNTPSWKFSINTIGSLDFILGYRNTQSDILTVQQATGAAIVDLRSPPTIYIRSSLTAGNYLSANGTDSVLCTVQNSALFTQTIFQRSPAPDLDLFPVSSAVGMINFQLVDEYGYELNVDSGQDWELTVGLYA